MIGYNQVLFWDTGKCVDDSRYGGGSKKIIMFCGIFRGFGLDFFECSWAIELGWAMLRVEVSKALLLIPSTRTRRSFCAS